MIFKNNNIDLNGNKIYLMGILNITPDSFSDGGKYNKPDKALFRVEEMINQGASIIDVGGESTRPFSEPVSEAEEFDRVIPMIESISRNFSTIISVDTYKNRIADEALSSGAEIINDISGFTYDPDMIKIAKKHNAKCVVMHIKGTPKDMQVDPFYTDVVNEIFDFMKSRIHALNKAGITDIIIDPGFGFGKSLDDNYILLKNLSKFLELNCPILAGISRKSMIGKITQSEPEDRVEATISLNAAAVLNGARILRVHDIKENFQALKVLEKYLES